MRGRRTEAVKCGKRFDSEAEFAVHWDEEGHDAISCTYEGCQTGISRTVPLTHHERFPFHKRL